MTQHKPSVLAAIVKHDKLEALVMDKTNCPSMLTLEYYMKMPDADRSPPANNPVFSDDKGKVYKATDGMVLFVWEARRREYVGYRMRRYSDVSWKGVEDPCLDLPEICLSFDASHALRDRREHGAYADI